MKKAFILILGLTFPCWHAYADNTDFEAGLSYAESSSFGSPSRSFGSPGRSFGPPSRFFGPPSRFFGPPSRFFGPPSRRSSGFPGLTPVDYRPPGFPGHPPGFPRLPASHH